MTTFTTTMYQQGKYFISIIKNYLVKEPELLLILNT